MVRVRVRVRYRVRVRVRVCVRVRVRARVRARVTGRCVWGWGGGGGRGGGGRPEKSWTRRGGCRPRSNPLSCYLQITISFHSFVIHLGCLLDLISSVSLY